MPTQPTIINVGYRSTNYWVVSSTRSRLLVDIGWPGMMGAMRASLRRMRVPFDEIRYALATHYHIDHAGLAQEFKNAGVALLVLESQIAAIPLMKNHTKPQDHFVDITLNDCVTISFADSRAILAKIGIAGQILATPGHSNDSVSLLLDDGSVFTGDLPPVALAQDVPAVAQSWQLLREHGATRIFPGHGPTRPMEPENGH
jgi:ribonuclease/clavin/mitogillin